MSLEIKSSVIEKLPIMVKTALSKMPLEDQAAFQIEFEKKSKSPGLMLFLAIFFPVQLFVLGKMGLGLAFWFTGGGFFVWYIVEIFLAFKRTKEYNEDAATQILTNMKLMMR